jgi:hypothetical protein
MEILIAFIIGLIVGVVGAGIYAYSHEAKFIAAIAATYGKTVAEVTAIKAKIVAPKPPVPPTKPLP